MRRALLLPLLWAALAGCSDAPAQQTAASDGPADFPALTGRVVDTADLIAPEMEGALAGRLAELEKNTTDQVVIVTVPALGERDIADYARDLGNHWGIGRKDRDNGVLLLVAPSEKRVRIAVGEGLEPVLTDARAQEILDERMLPAFREGDYEGAIVGGTEAVVETLEGAASALPEAA